MKSLFEILENKKQETGTEKIRNARQLYLKDFLDELNKQVGKSYLKNGKAFKVKEVKKAQLGFMLSHIPTGDLQAFYKQCQTAKCGFSKCFWGALKPRNKIY